MTISMYVFGTMDLGEDHDLGAPWAGEFGDQGVPLLLITSERPLGKCQLLGGSMGRSKAADETCSLQDPTNQA